MVEPKKNYSVHLPTYVLKSVYRKKLFFELVKKPYQTQAQLLKKTEIALKYRSHVSRTIKELLDHDLIECENPLEKSYKMYKLSEQGLKVKDEIEKYEQNY
ncbi:hypothetical protein H6501_03775 [Candidatus Woesearchaeota archaeon]|nr:hypothetical protein [Nanoarchaeota archaeon]MCB9370690.1 hypothetical protein [Candidatus Woesearchaeota archaeon]USN43774.1 MAG: hypothetical protein H6500_05275 [Candidatus Woesearchaeota archaeon]